MDHQNQPPIVFTWRNALLGLVAYIIVTIIIACVFL